ncbi:MAG: GWxTD domain-containing protein [Candidatus Aminicenantales bacterium]
MPAKMMRKELVAASGSIIIFIFLLSSCTTTPLEKRLDRMSEEFFSKVRYIITAEESKIFLELPPEKRQEFIEKFWQRRDPTPGTPRNEYREAYFQRIEEANRLFKGGRPGWLQDRGRIYILFGPPDERQTNPMGGRVVDPYVHPETMVEGSRSPRIAAGEKPTETWVYYNLFSSLQRPHAVRLVFVDVHGTGDYKLTTNLDEILPGTMGAETEFAPNLVFTHELSKEEAQRAELHQKRHLFNFSWEFIKNSGKKTGSNLSIKLRLPYSKIIFREEARRLKAELSLSLSIKSASGEEIWDFAHTYLLDLREEFLKQNREGTWEEEIPVPMRLKKGEYSVYISLANRSGDQEVEKLLPLKI